MKKNYFKEIESFAEKTSNEKTLKVLARQAKNRYKKLQKTLTSEKEKNALKEQFRALINAILNK